MSFIIVISLSVFGLVAFCYLLVKAVIICIQKNLVKFLLKIHNNFYFKDFKNQVEVFNLKFDGAKIYNLNKFLSKFDNSSEIIEIISKNYSTRKKIILNFKNSNLKLIANTNLYKGKNVHFLFINIIDLSHLNKIIDKQALENKILTKKLQFLQETIDNSPFIIYGKRNTNIISNKLCNNYKEEIFTKNPEENERKIKIGENEYFITNVVRNNSHYLFASQVYNSTKDLKSYMNYLNAIFNTCCDPIILIDQDLNIIVRNDKFDKIVNCGYVQLIQQQGGKRKYLDSIEKSLNANLIFQFKFNNAEFNAIHIPSYLYEDLIVVIFKKTLG